MNLGSWTPDLGVRDTGALGDEAVVGFLLGSKYHLPGGVLGSTLSAETEQNRGRGCLAKDQKMGVWQ